MNATPPPKPRLVRSAARPREALTLEFAPALVRLQESAPSPLGRSVLYALLALLLGVLVWSALGKLDIVAVAEGKLVPESFVKIVQPAEAGIVREILVKAGDVVREGQVLMRMDSVSSEADGHSLQAELRRKSITLRRMDAELGSREFQRVPGDPEALFFELQAQFRANRAALEAALGTERANLEKARQELAAAAQIEAKLAEVLPHYRTQDAAFERLVKEGFAGALMASEKQRDRIEKEQELRTQRHVIEAARSAMAQSGKRLAQIASDYRRQLYAERHDIQAQLERVTQELTKQAHRQELLELKASQAGVVKDIATHTAGTVVQPGTVLLTVVPQGEVLKAEVWVGNQDIGFVHSGQPVKLKLAAFPFQQYGMVEGMVEHVSADAADAASQGVQAGGGGIDRNGARDTRSATSSYRTLVALKSMTLDHAGHPLALTAGMQTNAEILLGRRSVLEYLLSPVRKAFHEAARER